MNNITFTFGRSKSNYQLERTHSQNKRGIITVSRPTISNHSGIVPSTPIEYVAKNNILYLLAHKTLTDFEIPIIISRGYGVFIPKKKTSLDKMNSLCDDFYKYDDSLQNINASELNILNDIDWYNNNITLTQNIINLLNTNFKYIFITLLTSDNLLIQLIQNFKGFIYYRFFGLESNLSYKDMVIKYTSPRVKYIFGYYDIYNYEQSLSSFFNVNNSNIVRIGCPDNFIKTYENTHKGTNNKICFVCSKINHCPYYTNIYNEFIRNFGTKYDYMLLGKNNETLIDNKKYNNLSDNEYFNKMSECKLMYYHSMEPRHLHYHPIEALIIGLPVLFYRQSLLNRFLVNSPGRCNNLNEVYVKINRILNNDVNFINKIKKEQQKFL